MAPLKMLSAAELAKDKNNNVTGAAGAEAGAGADAEADAALRAQSLTCKQRL
jgi:hypothetical protein